MLKSIDQLNNKLEELKAARAANIANGENNLRAIEEKATAAKVKSEDAILNGTPAEYNAAVEECEKLDAQTAKVIAYLAQVKQLPLCDAETVDKYAAAVVKELETKEEAQLKKALKLLDELATITSEYVKDYEAANLTLPKWFSETTKQHTYEPPHGYKFSSTLANLNIGISQAVRAAENCAKAKEAAGK